MAALLLRQCDEEIQMSLFHKEEWSILHLLAVAKELVEHFRYFVKISQSQGLRIETTTTGKSVVDIAIDNKNAQAAVVFLHAEGLMSHDLDYPDGRTILHYAAEWGDVAALKEALPHFTVDRVMAKDKHYKKAGHLAMQEYIKKPDVKYLQAVALLLEAGDKRLCYDFPQSKSKNAIHLAAEHGDVTLVKVFVQLFNHYGQRILVNRHAAVAGLIQQAQIEAAAADKAEQDHEDAMTANLGDDGNGDLYDKK